MDERLVNYLGISLVRIPPGTLTIAGTTSEERPCKICELKLADDIYVSQFPISQQQYVDIMGKHPFFEDATQQAPATRVSFFDATRFCDELTQSKENKSARQTFRLPTEDEWEYICRAGATNEYPFGNDAAELHRYACFADNSGYKPPDPDLVTCHDGGCFDVGTLLPNAYGVYDMCGNVWESLD